MKTTYKLPDNASTTLEGLKAVPNIQLASIHELLEEAPLDSLNTFLDIGVGRGEMLKWLAQKGKKCTGIGLEVASYKIDFNELKQSGIEILECNAEKMPFENKSFDGIIMSHVLEHCFNVGLVLQEVRRVLSDGGWLFVFVPPHDGVVCSGHVAVGWNVGQLMYVLLVNGFDVKNGKFVRYANNICAYVQKNKIPLPPLRGDWGDIHILQEKGFFPVPIASRDGLCERFYGDIKSINWDSASRIIRKISTAERRGLKRKFLLLVSALSKILPARIRFFLSGSVVKIGTAIKGDLGEEANKKINPTILRD